LTQLFGWEEEEVDSVRQWSRVAAEIKRDSKVKLTLGSCEVLDEDEEDEVKVLEVRASAGKNKAEGSGLERGSIREINFWAKTAVASSQFAAPLVVAPIAPNLVDEEAPNRRARAPNERVEETEYVSVEQAALQLRVKDIMSKAVAAIQAHLEDNKYKKVFGRNLGIYSSRTVFFSEVIQV
jgi:hypothetical protein